MAERRMFAKSIVLSDAFLDMPLSARCLYFTLGMLADDDGFIGSPKSVMRQCGASQDDMAILLQKRYVLAFESGVIVIKHWRMNNYLQNDRHKSTTYLEELDTLVVDKRGAYTEADKACIQNVYTDKNSIDKDSKEKNIKNIIPPTLEMVKEYCQERNNSVDPEAFVSFYESKGWMIGKNKMKDWQSAVRTWERSRKESSGSVKPKKAGFEASVQKGYDFDELQKLI